MKTITTRQLTKEELLAQTEAIPELLIKLGIFEAIFQFGYNCKTEDIYKEFNLDTDEIKPLIDKNIKDKSVELGKSEFFITDILGSYEFRFSDTFDLHLSSEEEELVDLVLKLWKNLNPIVNEIIT
jgi:hypothetical protein